ncbi:MAG: succinate dehydrogenase/fumarate reductase iron-sulfur subunit [Conexivisphaerales archaeon]
MTEQAVSEVNLPEKTLKIKVFRYSEDGEESYSSYEVKVRNGMTLLDGLLHIKEKLDPTLTFRYSCRMGICGSCGVVANGKEKLSCKTQLIDYDQQVEVRPLNNLPVIKDLVVEFKPITDKNRSIKPYLIRDDIDKNLNREFRQSPDELNNYLSFANCIMCGLCYSACPTNATDELYLGPQALAKAYRYIADSRDSGAKERMEIINEDHGVWSCHFAGSCSDVCPKGVDPAFAIQQLKALALFRSSALKRKKPAETVDKARESVQV